MRKVQEVLPRRCLPFVSHAEHSRNLAELCSQIVQVTAKRRKKRLFVTAITIVPERPMCRAFPSVQQPWEVRNEKACNRNPGCGGRRIVGAGKRAGCLDRRGSGGRRCRRWPGLRLLRRVTITAPVIAVTPTTTVTPIAVIAASCARTSTDTSARSAVAGKALEL